MEVAGQWRREWAGTAEYGKVTEGGVTRRVARAMEVLQASGPGARLRVLRAAYHATAGPGAHAESFLMHSSRRVISSGSQFLDSPTFMTKPLEISSTPLESSPERFSDAENYKVTEPDDTEISEPSKWKSTTSTATRMPSEESSSTDNASVIDLDSRMNISKHTDLLRKLSLDSDNSDFQPKQSNRRSTKRESPLLDTPVTLSTLKFKSLLNGSCDNWNDRRKSYSFEDTSPLNESILHKNDTLAMDSSTDSGICKSSEIVDDHVDDRLQQTQFSNEAREESFKDWLAKNRLNRQYKDMSLKSQRDDRIIEEPSEHNIALQSKGKVSIALPMNNQTDDRFQYIKSHFNGDDRRVKRVEFCKTELHFAAESGKVNIIATDEKPPPSIDFRRRRSAFVPIKSSFDKPVTLFGERLSDFSEKEDFDSTDNEYEENTAATKSILKNKIPKPKPYLLGENMDIGQGTELKSKDVPIHKREYIIPTAVSIINKQLEPEERMYRDGKDIGPRNTSIKTDEQTYGNVINSTVARTLTSGPLYDKPDICSENKYSNRTDEDSLTQKFETDHSVTSSRNYVQHKLRNLQRSPVFQVKPKTRQLRENELMYFGINSSSNNKKNNILKNDNETTNRYKEPKDLQSVKLIQNISNSVYNSEAESDVTPEYQNVPMKINFAPIPIPRTRVNKSNHIEYSIMNSENAGKVFIIKPTIEIDYNSPISNKIHDTRRSRERKLENSTDSSKSRSISEPPKHRNRESLKGTSRREKSHSRNQAKNDNFLVPLTGDHVKSKIKEQVTQDDAPIYANVTTEENNIGDKIADVSSQNKADIYLQDNQIVKREKKHDRKEESPKNKTNKLNIHERHGTSKSKSSDSDKRSNKARDSFQTKRKNVDVNCNDRKSKEINISSKNADDISEDSVKSKMKENLVTQNIPISKNHPKDNKAKQMHNDLNEPAKNCLDKHKDYDKNTTTKYNSKRRDRSRSNDKVETNQGSKKSSSNHSSIKHRTRAEKESDRNKRREYIINYDDKNGTVSSVSKVKATLPKRKTVHSEIKNKVKSPDNSLLQCQEHLWMHSGIDHIHRKWKTKRKVQRTCQLL